MTDRPIIFSAPMVRALLEGRKTMTRRLAIQTYTDKRGVANAKYERASPWQKVQVGDRLWVRENFSYQDLDVDQITEFGGVHFWADGNPEFGNWTRPKPSIHMPRFASRLTLVVTATKVEPLQDISEADAAAEGAPWYVYGHGIITDEEYHADPGYQPNKRMGFCQVWNDLHGWNPSAWAENPEVVAISFRVIKANIDEVSPPHKTHTAALAGGL